MRRKKKVRKHTPQTVCKKRHPVCEMLTNVKSPLNLLNAVQSLADTYGMDKCQGRRIPLVQVE